MRLSQRLHNLTKGCDTLIECRALANAEGRRVFSEFLSSRQVDDEEAGEEVLLHRLQQPDGRVSHHLVELQAEDAGGSLAQVSKLIPQGCAGRLTNAKVMVELIFRVHPLPRQVPDPQAVVDPKLVDLQLHLLRVQQVVDLLIHDFYVLHAQLEPPLLRLLAESLLPCSELLCLAPDPLEHSVDQARDNAIPRSWSRPFDGVRLPAHGVAEGNDRAVHSFEEAWSSLLVSRDHGRH
mmetsp:Transcript_23601/g.76885  ORF Transcript_23601/g.76885 Transcript_23601/m.76885 type:complete len:236 (-) Transcript_23601:403-1110(-)